MQVLNDKYFLIQTEASDTELIGEYELILEGTIDLGNGMTDTKSITFKVIIIKPDNIPPALSPRPINQRLFIGDAWSYQLGSLIDEDVDSVSIGVDLGSTP